MIGRRSALYAALLTLGVLALHASWTWRDQRYQANDPGFYLQVAHEIYWAGEHHGAAHAAGVVYRHRHWKPILHPALLAPFLFWTDGDTRQAFRVYAAVLGVLLIQGIFFTLRALIARGELAFLATLMLGLAPWLLCSQLEFGSEAPWMTASTWFLGCLIRSRDLRDRKLAIAATTFLLLAVLLRPLETSVCLVAPFVFYLLALSGTGSRAWWLHGATIGIESLVALLLIFHPLLLQTQELPGAWVAGIAAALTAYTFAKLGLLRVSGRSAALWIQGLWSGLWLGVLLWFLPCLRTLTDWILACTIGDQSRTFPELIPQNFLLLFLQKGGAFLFLPALLLLANPRAVREYWRPRKPLLGYLLWAGTAFAVIASFTTSRDFRYYQVSWFVWFAIIMASVSALELTRGRRRVLTAALVGVIALQAYVIVPPLFLAADDLRRLPLRQALSRLAGDTWMARPPGDEKLFLDFFERLRELPIADDDFLVLHTLNPVQANRAGDPRKFTIRAHELGRRWRFGRYVRGGGGAQSTDDLVKDLMARGNVLIVGPPTAGAGAQGASPESRISEALHACTAADCARYGLRPIGEHTVPATDGAGAASYRIFRHDGPVPGEAEDCYR